MIRSSSVLRSWKGSWLVRTATALEGSGLTGTRAVESRRRTASGDTEVCFWAFYAVLNLRWRLWVPGTRGALAAERLPRTRSRLGWFGQSIASTSDGMNR